MDYNDEKVRLAAEVIQSFTAVSKATAKFTQQNAAGLGLTLQQLGILNTIYSSPGITLKEITERLLFAKSTASVNVDELVNLGLVTRITSDKDRREINLEVTAEGKELSKKSSQNALSYKAMSSALDKTAKEDIQTLLRIHKELLTGLQEYIPDPVR